MMMKSTVVSAFLFFATLSAAGQSITLIAKLADSVSIRGLSVVDDKVAWLGGSKGTVARSVDGGRTWKPIAVPGHERSDFRSVYGFSERTAIIANAGSPAHILLTDDGGKNWRVVYTNAHADAFIDGVDFWNEKDGVIYGDPIDGKMLILLTSDGGKTWKLLEDESRPRLMPGEASFAASGTGIRCSGEEELYIVTGGKHSRLFFSADRGKTWSVTEPPIIQGKQGTGIFSVTKLRSGRLLIVGGDFEQPGLAEDHVFFSDDSGKTWVRPTSQTGGYRECVEDAGVCIIAAGPSGVDISADDGDSWKTVSDEGFHVVRKSRKGNTTLLAGGSGKIGRFRTLVIR